MVVVSGIMRNTLMSIRYQSFPISKVSGKFFFEQFVYFILIFFTFNVIFGELFVTSLLIFPTITFLNSLEASLMLVFVALWSLQKKGRSLYCGVLHF